MSLLDPVEDFLISVMLKKAVARAVQLAVAYALAHGVKQAGIDLDPDALTVSAMAGLEALRNYLKVKRGWDFLP